MKVNPVLQSPSLHSPFTAQALQSPAHLAQLRPSGMNPSSHLEQAVLEQDVHELVQASHDLASFKKVPVSHAEQAVSVQVVHLSLHLAQVVVVTVPAGATDL